MVQGIDFYCQKALRGVFVLFFIFIASSFCFAQQESGQQALFFHQRPDHVVQCRLCPRNCLIPSGSRGACRVRENRDGVLYTLVYANPCSLNIDPIEKAPFYHFMPGHQRLCLATVGCNLKCKNCQNWQISQALPGELREYQLSPQEVVDYALKAKTPSICFTYSEPTIFFEYVYDIAAIAQEHGIKTSIVSNGYINEEPLRMLIGVLDAVKIDLKSFSEDFYRDICSGELGPVLRTLQILKEEGIHFEIVNLVIPTLNDDMQQIKQMSLWIKENLGKDVPVHFSRFHPAYRLTQLPPTPVETLSKAVSLAREIGLRYVYIGNVPGHRDNSTFCPACSQRLVHRVGFSILENHITPQGKCKFCHHAVPGIWK